MCKLQTGVSRDKRQQATKGLDKTPPVMASQDKHDVTVSDESSLDIIRDVTYVAVKQYDPAHFSRSRQPQREIPLKAGDLVRALGSFNIFNLLLSFIEQTIVESRGIHLVSNPIFPLPSPPPPHLTSSQ